MMLGSCLGRDHVGDAVHQFVSQVAASPMACGKTVAVPARATPCKASFHQSYCGNAETFNCRRGVHHLRDFFFERHARDEIVNAYVDREVRDFYMEGETVFAR